MIPDSLAGQEWAPCVPPPDPLEAGPAGAAPSQALVVRCPPPRGQGPVDIAKGTEMWVCSWAVDESVSCTSRADVGRSRRSQTCK